MDDEYEDIIYPEEDNLDDLIAEEPVELVEPEEEYAPTFEQISSTERGPAQKERIENIAFVKKYIINSKRKVKDILLAEFHEKIIHLNPSLLKELSDKKKQKFTVEKFRYYRFLEFLVSKCDG
jgi:hypothetical protein